MARRTTSTSGGRELAHQFTEAALHPPTPPAPPTSTTDRMSNGHGVIYHEPTLPGTAYSLSSRFVTRPEWTEKTKESESALTVLRVVRWGWCICIAI